MATRRMRSVERQDGVARVQTLKRRGLIAGAATAALAVATRRSEQRVAADSFTNVVVNGPASIGVDAYTGSAAVFDTGVSGNGKSSGVRGTSYNSSVLQSTGGFFQGNNNGIQAMVNGSGAPTNWRNAAVAGWGAGGAGVIGVSGESDGNLGVYGYSASASAIYGNTNAPFTTPGGPGGAGLYGSGANAQGAGVIGTGGAVGVHGQCDVAGGVGVRGQSTVGTGVVGISGQLNGVSGTTSGTGVVAGVYGTSSTAYGVLGTTAAAGYSGLTGTTRTAGAAALAATALVNSAFAAYFKGYTVVEGNFAVTGNKAAAALLPDGTRRLLYCIEAPEAWFEDFGKAKLVSGKAVVTLDPTFAALVHTDDYHVFLTEIGGTHHHLSIERMGATGFTVVADPERAATKGKTIAEITGMFSYRVVARRKDNPGTRLETFTVPRINIPDPARLPTK